MSLPESFLAPKAARLLQRMGVKSALFSSGTMPARTPVDGGALGRVRADTDAAYAEKADAAVRAFQAWRAVPAPRRGELVRLLGNVLREYKEDLGALISIESGKIISEGQGEVQEMIDICDFATGLSRQVCGLTIASERPQHAMRETWHPLGPVAVITAFNFPAAVWCWNFALAIVCGDPVVWKPSEKTPLVALACQALFEKAAKIYGDAPEGLSQLLMGGREIGEKIARDPRFPVVSATGSTRMGKAIAPLIAERFGRSLLELGGNGAMILAPSADMNLALSAAVFGAVGTAGQRCTTQRRLIVHESAAAAFLRRLEKAYASVRIGNPLENGVLMGPLIDEAAFMAMQDALRQAAAEGGSLLCGGQRQLARKYPHAFYASPAIVRMKKQTDVVRHETFAPILYVMTYKKFADAIAIQNDVPQGLSSCVFTNEMREAELFLSSLGSDCGIANVNLGTSGAEIGGAFGGDKETGGGRESGSDSWKAYMRRATATVNHGAALPLAQGVRFEV
jgi:aldehyde dehydrogenase (NAD+)